MKATRTQDARIGGASFGWYVLDGEIIADKDEQQHLQRMIAMRKAGEAFAKIADVINAAGVQTKRGGRWCGRAVRLVLNRAGIA